MEGTPRAVCVGETMAALLPDRPGPLEDVPGFRSSVGGAEANVARGLAALGVPAAWLGRVGDDGFGRRIVRELAAGGVDTSHVVVDPERPTGLYVKETGPDGSVLHYYRDGSAGSALDPGMLEAAALRDAALVHLSGITPALSDDAMAFVTELVRRPRTGLLSFDLNWRPALWRGRDPGVLGDLLNAADLVLLGADEAAEVFGTGAPRKLRKLLPGPRALVVKDAGHQVTVVTPEGAHTEPALRVEIVDHVGAGDAFAAGYLAGTLRGYDQRRRLRLGHLMAASTLAVPGDHGAPPPPGRVAALLDAPPAEWAATVIGGTP
ncbi:sugar kinase [Actinomadura kijaniata]|uniref:sugar kinase n=1 Tax=Actinomadura kijaniata TaxID=46161 RepID=UPI0009FE78F4|nr:sugar kinase [Actinomadura kijaniata]